MRRFTIAAAFTITACACLPDGAYGPDLDEDAGIRDGGSAAERDGGSTADAGTRDGGVSTGTGYAHVAPPSGAVPAILQGQTWIDHLEDDLLPYWRAPEAQGTPVGNFPTYRGMDGSIQNPTDRYPRMLGRQTFTYAMAYLLTGDESLLVLAKAGADWLMQHARDTTNGGWHALLGQDGMPKTGAKTAQDTSYVVQGLAAYYFVTRDPAVEQAILDTRDLLFDPTKYWDEANGRIKDALDPVLMTEVDVENDNGWEIVAQLDPLNAFMMLSQPVLSDPARRAQFLDDMERLMQLVVDDFWADGIFWGVHNKQGQYRTRHVDFGHTLKSYWMVLQVDKRLDDHPFQSFLADNVHTWIERAYDDGRWAKRPTSATATEYGSDWWIYAEADQITATLNMLDYRYSDELEQTAANWIEDYVDGARHEVIPGIQRNGSPVFGWPANDTAKCNMWKNGFHSTEHAVVMYLTGRNLEGQPATLHFAVPAAQANSFIARPYIFQGTEAGRTVGGTIAVGGETLTEVEVRFTELY